jgi:hypothetical protein
MVVCLLGVTSVLGGCSKIMGPKASEPVPSYPEGPAGLEAMFRDVLTAAKADERERVHDYFQSLKMTPAELVALFGPQANELQKPYDDMMATLIHRGAVELVAIVYEKKYDTVEVMPMVPPDLSDRADRADRPDQPDQIGRAQPAAPSAGPKPASVPRPEDVALARALVAHPTLYSIRFKKNGETLGNRYDFFFYVDGRWRTGNQLGKVLARRAAELTDAPAAR